MNDLLAKIIFNPSNSITFPNCYQGIEINHFD